MNRFTYPLTYVSPARGERKTGYRLETPFIKYGLPTIYNFTFYSHISASFVIIHHEFRKNS